MLGKLIKYEWKSLWGVETLIASIILVFSIAEAVTLQTPLYANLFLDQKDLPEQMEVFSTMTLFFGFFLTAMLCSGVVFASLIYLGIRFYRSMYCDEGYLTHTLPVSKKQLLTAKILTAVLWQIIITLAVAVSVGVLVASAVFWTSIAAAAACASAACSSGVFVVSTAIGAPASLVGSIPDGGT